MGLNPIKMYPEFNLFYVHWENNLDQLMMRLKIVFVISIDFWHIIFINFSHINFKHIWAS